MTKAMKQATAQLNRALPIAVLVALLPVLPAEAGASSTRLGRAHASGGGVHVGARTGVRHHGYHGQRHHGHHFNHHYGYHARPYSYGYYPWYGLGWGGFWLGPAPRRVYLLTQPAAGIIETDVRPKKAVVKLDGAVVGQSRDYNGRWDRLGLPPGRHTIEFSAPGHMTLEVQLDVESGSYHHFDEELNPGEGRDPRSIRLPPEQEREAPAPTVEDHAELPTGFLRVRVQPTDAVIYLDGEFLARADELARLHGALPVAPGRHVLEVVRPGHAGQRVEVAVESDRSATVEVELQRE